jgi:hypothetical protein
MTSIVIKQKEKILFEKVGMVKKGVKHNYQNISVDLL